MSSQLFQELSFFQVESDKFWMHFCLFIWNFWDTEAVKRDNGLRSAISKHIFTAKAHKSIFFYLRDSTISTDKPWQARSPAEGKVQNPRGLKVLISTSAALRVHILLYLKNKEKTLLWRRANGGINFQRGVPRIRINGVFREGYRRYSRAKPAPWADEDVFDYGSKWTLFDW